MSRNQWAAGLDGYSARFHAAIAPHVDPSNSMASTDMNIYLVSTRSARKRRGTPAVVRLRHGPPPDPPPEGSGPQGGVPKGLPCPAFVTASLPRHIAVASLLRRFAAASSFCYKAGVARPQPTSRSLVRRDYAHVLSKNRRSTIWGSVGRAGREFCHLPTCLPAQCPAPVGCRAGGRS